MLALPNQTPGLLAQAGLTRDQLDRSAWALLPDGTAYGAVPAVVAVLRELPGWRWITVLYAAPGLSWAADGFYVWFARHRGQFARWGVTPEMEQSRG